MSDTNTCAPARTRVRIAFNRRRPPTLDEVYAAVEQALGPAGCTFCGFDGIDLRLTLEDVLGPDPTPWVATTEQVAGV